MKEYIEALYQNVLVLDSGARGATTSFVENGQGDVLLTWENEGYLAMEEYPGEYELVTPLGEYPLPAFGGGGER